MNGIRAVLDKGIGEGGGGRCTESQRPAGLVVFSCVIPVPGCQCILFDRNKNREGRCFQLT